MTTTQTPFLDFNSFSVEEVQEPLPLVRSATPTSSPFLSVYELNDGEVPQNDPLREAYASLMYELHDEEFDEALFELQCHGRAMHDEQLAMGKPRAEADRLVAQHFSQLIHASDAMVDSMAREFAPREQAGIVDHEIDAFVEGYTPTENLDPEFENIFGGILRKVGRGLKAAAVTAWRGIKKYGIQPFLNLMKQGLREVLKSALTMAINKIPEQFRPAAQLLAQKLGFSTVRVEVFAGRRCG